MAGPGGNPNRGGPGNRVGSVEVTRLDDGSVAVRDTKTHGAPPVVFSPQEWADFARGVRSNQFDGAPAGRPAPAGLDAETTIRFKV